MNDVVIRRATSADVAGIVAMIADDQLGAVRESVDDLTPYLHAFELIDSEKVASLRSASTDVTSRSLPSLIRTAAMPAALAKPCIWKSGPKDMKASSGAELSEKRRPETVNLVWGDRSKSSRSLSSTSIWS